MTPSTQILEKALKLDRVHTFGNFSKSQLLEKIDWIIEKTNFYWPNRAEHLDKTFITIISVADAGEFAESEDICNKRYL